MKRWHWAGLVALVWLGVVSGRGTALAQDGEMPSILSDVLVPILVIINEVLGHFVVGNTLTDPAGESLVVSLNTMVHYVADFLAQLSILLPANVAG